MREPFEKKQSAFAGCNTEVYSETFQTSKIELFAKKVNGWQLTPLAKVSSKIAIQVFYRKAVQKASQCRVISGKASMLVSCGFTKKINSRKFMEILRTRILKNTSEWWLVQTVDVSYLYFSVQKIGIWNDASAHCMKYRNSTQFPGVNRPKLCGNSAFPQNFHTRKLGEMTIFYVEQLFRIFRGKQPVKM